MAGANPDLEKLAKQDYKYGFVTDIEEDRVAPGLTEDVVRLISAKKNEPEWLLDYRLKAYRRFREMLEEEGAHPEWAKVAYPKIDYDDIVYYSAPKQQNKIESLDDLDPELRETYDKLGISLLEQKRLNGIAVDAVFDSVSVATTFKAELEKHGIIFLAFLASHVFFGIVARGEGVAVGKQFCCLLQFVAFCCCFRMSPDGISKTIAARFTLWTLFLLLYLLE